MILDLLWRVKLDLPLLELLELVRSGRTYRGLRPFQIESVHQTTHQTSFCLGGPLSTWTRIHSRVRLCRGDPELF